jgi:hypothetical protein
VLDYDDRKIYYLLSSVCNRYGVDPSIPRESRQLFRELLSQYDGPTDRASVTAWLKEQIPRHFVSLRRRPKWIQSPEWPFANGKPMIFAGQIDLNREEREKVTPTLYHDDTSLYVFIGRGEYPEVIIQQY